MTTPSSVFVGYSRKDYYFAESLAFELLQRGHRAWFDSKDLHPGKDWRNELEAALNDASVFVLVASRDSIDSPNVRDEWQRALNQRKRILIARVDSVQLPLPLRECDTVDFRGGFGRSVVALCGLLVPAGATHARTGTLRARRFALRLPPWVAFIAFTLVVPALGFAALADYGSSSSETHRAHPAWVRLLVVPFEMGLLWVIALAFLWRRMGMTRLALSLAVLAFLYARPAYLFLRFGNAGLRSYSLHIGDLINGYPLVLLVLMLLPLLGLGVVGFLRPADLFRWSPTGTVWPWYRMGHAGQSTVQIPDARSAFASAKRFRIVHDEVDAPAAQRLREELQAMSGEESAADGAGIMTVVLITQRARFELIERARQAQGQLLTVIGTGVRASPALDWLWRMQWIDFRAWTIKRPEREHNLPRVPETLTLVRLPGTVRWTHQFVCALGGLSLVPTPLHPDMNRTQPSGADSLHIWLHLGVLILTTTLARRLLRRRVSYQRFFHWTVVGALATTGIVATDVLMYTKPSDLSPSIVSCLVFPSLALLWLLRTRASIRYWFPAPGAVNANAAAELGMQGNWQTLIWISAYTIVLGLGTGLITPRRPEHPYFYEVSAPADARVGPIRAWISAQVLGDDPLDAALTAPTLAYAPPAAQGGR